MAMIMLTIHIHSGFHLLPTLFVLLTLLSALSGSSFPWRSPGHRPGTEDGSTGRGEVRLQFVSAKDVATGLFRGSTPLRPCRSRNCVWLILVGRLSLEELKLQPAKGSAVTSVMSYQIHRSGRTDAVFWGSLGSTSIIAYLFLGA